MANHSRVERVSDEVQKVIVTLLTTKVRDPRLQWVSITDVEMSRDLSYAKVYFSFLDQKTSEKEVLKAFESASGFFRSSLAKTLRLRVAPQLRFFYDDSLNYGNKMETLIKVARQEDETFIQPQDDDVNEGMSMDKEEQKRQRLR